MMEWKVEPAGPVRPELWVGWDDLNSRRFDNHPMLSSLFVEGLLKNFGTGQERLCWLPRHDGQSGMAAALWLEPGSSGIWVTVLPAQAQLGLALVENPGQLRSLVPRLGKLAVAIDLLCQDPDLVETANLDPRSDEIDLHYLTVSIPLKGTFEDWWAMRPEMVRKNLRRYQRRSTAPWPFAHSCRPSPAC